MTPRPSPSPRALAAALLLSALAPASSSRASSPIPPVRAAPPPPSCAFVLRPPSPIRSAPRGARTALLATIEGDVTAGSAVRDDDDDDDEPTTVSTAVSSGGGTTTDGTLRRPLGSQEMLMLPRQYELTDATYPRMNHVASYVLSSTPSIDALTAAMDDAIRTHPLLRAHVEGTGYPERHVDLMGMVRYGDPDPLTFVSPPVREAGVRAEDLLRVVDVRSSDRSDLDDSWMGTFLADVDDTGGGWCDLRDGPLWKVELHRLEGWENDDDGGGGGTPCAVVITTNHAISDQGSLNVVFDQILSDASDIETRGSIPRPAVERDMPVSLETSVLGPGASYVDVGAGGAGVKTLRYLWGKAAEAFRFPVLLPDRSGGRNSGSGERRTTTMQYRTLSEDATSALLKECRRNKVAMTNALAAAVAVTASDFIDGGERRTPGMARNYKVLQSLDMRRFGRRIDGCRTLSCQAGSMDLMLGPIPDRSGEAVRSYRGGGGEGEGGSSDAMERFWSLARESFARTKTFIRSGMPEEAVGVFDAGMAISEMNELVHQQSRSTGSKGRAYSAGITNAGVYGRGTAAERVGVDDPGDIKERRGKFRVLDVYYATSHARAGCLFPVSCMTVGGRVQCTFNPPSPIVDEGTNERFADAFVELLETVAGVGK